MRATLTYRRSGAGADTQRGVALVLSLVLVTVVAILGAAFTQLSSQTAREQSHAVKQLQAFYLAEAGLAEAFLSVRMGRTGAIGGAEAPATFGPGKIWVESVHTTDKRVYLRSTAVKDNTRVRLGLIVRPEDPPLGFFAAEDVLVESVLLVDGFDSSERSYAEEVIHIAEAMAPDAVPSSSSKDGTGKTLDPAFAEAREALRPLLVSADQSVIEAILTNQTIANEGGTFTINHQPVDPLLYWTSEEFHEFMRELPVIYPAFQEDELFGASDSDARALYLSELLGSSWLDLMSLSGASYGGGFIGMEPEAPERLEFHTVKGGLIGAGGDVMFTGGAEMPVEVHGSIVPGVNGSVVGVPAGAVSGSTDPRVMPVELEPVVVPKFASEGALTVDSDLPTVISGGQKEYDVLTVADARDLVLRGPMTLVVDDLILAPGARLTLDTADGDVEIFIRGELAMDPTSFMETTEMSSREVKIKAGGDDPVTSTIDLAGMSQFHGTIYAPETSVKIGTNFEVYGGAIAKRLEIGAGARLHFDSEAYDSDLPVPDQESWRILELPLVPQNIKDEAALAASVTLHDAHDLAAVEITLDYVDSTGVTRRYVGPESAFDWAQVVSADIQQRSIIPNAGRAVIQTTPTFDSAADPVAAAEVLAEAGASVEEEAGSFQSSSSDFGGTGALAMATATATASSDSGLDWQMDWDLSALFKLAVDILKGIQAWKSGG